MFNSSNILQAAQVFGSGCSSISSYSIHHQHTHLHCSLLNGFFPEWVSMCFFRPQAVMQEQSHRVQLNNFSPVWISMCVLRRLAIVQEQLHFLQANVFSPVCKSMWYFILPECLQEQLRCLHAMHFFGAYASSYHELEGKNSYITLR